MSLMVRYGLRIPGFDNYSITPGGIVYNCRGQKIAAAEYKGKNYVRIYKKGKRYTLSISKLLYEIYGEQDLTLELEEGERIFRYENTNYYITSNCRVYNLKHKRWIKTIYRNGYPCANVLENGKQKSVSLLKFLKARGGITL